MARARRRTARRRRAARPARVKRVVPTRTEGARLPILCSDCFEEFLVPASKTPEKIVCPECRHVGLRPEDDFFARALTQKREERKLFILAVGAGALFLVSLLVWGLVNSFQMQPDTSPTTNYLFLAVGLILLIAAVSFGFRYERSRWDVYF